MAVREVKHYRECGGEVSPLETRLSVQLVCIQVRPPPTCTHGETEAHLQGLAGTNSQFLGQL